MVLSSMDQLKAAAISMLKVKGASLGDPVCQQIATSDSIHFLETFLKEYGFSDSDLLSMYRIYFDNHE